jgi:hypothetical protein
LQLKRGVTHEIFLRLLRLEWKPIDVGSFTPRKKIGTDDVKILPRGRVTAQLVPVSETFAMPLKEMGLPDSERSDTSNACPKPEAELSRIGTTIMSFILSH